MKERLINKGEDAMEKTFKRSKKGLIFDLHPFETLHDNEGNEITVEWPDAKKELLNGKIIAQSSVMGGYFFLRIKNEGLQEYSGKYAGWKDVSFEKYDDVFESDCRNNVNRTEWLITNLIIE
ncbi:MULTISPECIES: hypothetical protein [unclassified Paenibacillus]|uniref:hypothetical protein n=1 Tax=unclassified Paenibacillus TaxID=185978 RepID=UPI0027840E84|nr:MULTISPECIES: hypothetical protein [unclassified Paenibacillus]MDQ0896250.1 hypothetical protein [Paenibacillus sp. V4I7]MDQ0913822.1 hypothetical protein [Paenibacillus sp. V4I5]